MPEVNILINATDKASLPFGNVNAAILALNASGMAAAKGGLFSLQNVIGVTLVASALAATAALSGLVGVISSSVGKAAAMEQGVANIGATMQLTDQEMVKLEDHIMKLALDPELVVSATEASEAIMALGQAGLSMTEITGGASKAVVLLANATGADFKSAANIATDVMSQFNIKAEDMDDAIDQIVGTTVASKMTIDDYRYAIGQAGGVAGMVGVTFEDFNAILAANASSFTGGSDAGTSYKTFLTQLIPDTNKSADAMRALGLFSGLTGAEFSKLKGEISDTEADIALLDPTSKKYGERLGELNEKLREQRGELMKGGSAFFDANGNMKSGEAIAGALATAFGGLSEAESIAAASAIFGRDAMRTALALAEGGVPIINSMKAAIGKTDAEESAARRMDTFSGALSIAKDIIGAISIGIGNQFLPVLRPLIETFSILASTHGPQLIALFGGIADRMTVVIAAVASMVDGFVTMKLVYEDGAGALMNFLEALGLNREMAQSIGRAYWDLRDTLENVMSVIRAAIAPVVDAIGKFVKWEDVLGAVARYAIPAVLTAIGGLIVSLASFLAPILAVTAAVAALRWAWEKDFLGIQTLTRDALKKISDWFFKESGLWKGNWDATWEYLIYRADRLIRIDLYNLIIGTWAEIKFQTKWNFTIIRDTIDDWAAKTNQDIRGWKDNTILTFVQFKDRVLTAFDDWINPIKKTVSDWISLTLAHFKQFVAASLAHFENLKDDAIELWNEWFGWFKPIEWYTRGKDIVEGLWEGVQEMWKNFMDWWTPKWESVKDDFEDAFGIHSRSTVFYEYGKNMMDGLGYGIKAYSRVPLGEVESLTNSMTAQMERLRDAVVGKVFDIKNLVKDLNLDPATMLPAAGGTGKIIGMIPGTAGGTALLQGAGNKLPGATRPLAALLPRQGEITTPGFPDTSASTTNYFDIKLQGSASASDDLMSTFNLLNSMYGTAP